jgi:hypothetical protein
MTSARLVAAWDRYWFRPASPWGLIGVRTLVVLNVLWILFSRPDLPDLAGWPREFWAAVSHFSALRYLLIGLPPVIERGLYGLLHITLVAALVGVAPRASCFISAALLYHFAPLEAIFWSRLGPYFNGLTFPVLALFALAFAARPRRDTPWSGEFRWPLALLQILFAFHYVGAWFSKLHTAGWAWVSADNIAGMVRWNMVWGVTTPLAPAIAASRLACWAIAILTMLIETLFILVPFSRWAARILVPLAALGHIGIVMVLGIVFLNLPLLLIYFDWDGLDEHARKRWRAWQRCRATADAAVRPEQSGGA